MPRRRTRSRLLEQIDTAPCLESHGYAEYGIDAGSGLIGTLQVRAPVHAFPPGVCEFGIVLFPRVRGKGIGTRAVELITARLFDDGWQRVQAATSVRNQAMRRVLEQAGYRFEGVMKGFAPGNDDTRDDYELWAVTRAMASSVG